MDWQRGFKKAIRLLGVDVVRLKNVPEVTFFGMRGQKFGCILDVGANDGGFARWALNMFPGSQIHCFEPISAIAEKLARWTDGNHPGLIVVHELALSDFEGEAPIIEHVDHPTSSSMLNMTQAGERLLPITKKTVRRNVRVTTLDAWAAIQPAMSDSILLKLDVQGLEAKVLRGGQGTLAKVDVCIIEVSIASIYEGQAEFSSLVETLADADLRYIGNLSQIHDSAGRPIYMDCVFRRGEMEKALGNDVAVSRTP